MDKLVIKIFNINKINKKNLRGNKILKKQNKLSEYLLNKNNPYTIKVGDIVVEMEYSNNNKTLSECMINIIKQKYKMSWFLKKNTSQ